MSQGLWSHKNRTKGKYCVISVLPHGVNDTLTFPFWYVANLQHVRVTVEMNSQADMLTPGQIVRFWHFQQRELIPVSRQVMEL